VLLDDAPVASRFVRREQMNSAAAQTYQSQIETRQRRVLDELTARKVPVTGSVSMLLNAIFVTAPASRVQEILAIPGVAAVRPMRRYQANLNRATTLMNAPAAWAKLGGQGNAGQGIKIAIIDSGIDQAHPAFQDASLPMPSGFPKCSGFSSTPGSTTPSTDDCKAFTNTKVIVARSYVPNIALANVIDPAHPEAQSQPDDYTPRDRLGHGTGVASAAAANPATGTVTITGMAPKAYLGNYKIAGTPGVNEGPGDDILIMAVQDALKDGMDIASLSWGSLALTGAVDTGAACGIPAGQPCDPLAYAYENAAKAGLVITVAAGNSGTDGLTYPYFNSISSPASAPSVIGVGATTNSHVLTPAVSANDPSAPANVKGLHAELSDSFFNVTAQFGATSAPLVDVTQLGDDGLACNPLPAYKVLADGTVLSLYNAFALIKRGTCFFDTKALNAQAVGAIGVVFYMADANPPFQFTAPDFVGPAVMISQADGLALKDYVDSHPNALTTIDTAGVEMNLDTFNQLEQIDPPVAANQLASYSSFGPTPDGAIKPDLVATGGLDGSALFSSGVAFPSSGLYLAAQSFDPNGELYSVNGYAAADGTSFAAPIAAGAAALVKQAHPNYTPAEIKSALVNAAAQDTTTDTGVTGNIQTVNAQWLGAGRLDAGAAVNASVLVQPATISFGFVTSLAQAVTRTLSVTNRNSGSITLSVTVTQTPAVAGVTIAADQTSLTLAAGASANLKITLSGTAPAAGSYTGAVSLQASGVSARLPYLFIVPSGTANNIVPMALTGTIQGIPGQGGSFVAVQVIDPYGAPVTNTPVAFSANRGLTFHSVSGEPACSPDKSSAVSCATDNYGIAYAEVILGPSTGNASITARVAGNTFTCSSQESQLCAFILPQPAITPGQVLNNASFVVGDPVAPGSIIAIKGSNLMEAGLLVNTSAGYDQATTPALPLVLDAVNVSFDVPSLRISVPAPIVAVSPSQINVQVPWELKGQPAALVKVIVDEQFGPAIYSNVVTASMADYTPAFFLNSGNVADAIDLSGHVIGSSNPAIRGKIIQLFANGLGPVTNQPASGFPASGDSSKVSRTTTPCVVTIGGQAISQDQVLYCGLAPGTAGEYQINVTVPTNIGTGNQPITVSIGGKTSPTQTVDTTPQTIVLPVQ
jgi:uncharacterized protein (TIGR03437 family)